MSHRDTINNTLSFLGSVIRCGEPYSDTVAAEVEAARAALDELVQTIVDLSVKLSDTQDALSYANGRLDKTEGGHGP